MASSPAVSIALEPPSIDGAATLVSLLTHVSPILPSTFCRPLSAPTVNSWEPQSDSDETLPLVCSEGYSQADPHLLSPPVPRKRKDSHSSTPRGKRASAAVSGASSAREAEGKRRAGVDPEDVAERATAVLRRYRGFLKRRTIQSSLRAIAMEQGWSAAIEATWIARHTLPASTSTSSSPARSRRQSRRTVKVRKARSEATSEDSSHLPRLSCSDDHPDACFALTSIREEEEDVRLPPIDAPRGVKATRAGRRRTHEEQPSVTVSSPMPSREEERWRGVYGEANVPVIPRRVDMTPKKPFDETEHADQQQETPAPVPEGPKDEREAVSSSLSPARPLSCPSLPSTPLFAFPPSDHVAIPISSQSDGFTSPTRRPRKAGNRADREVMSLLYSQKAGKRYPAALVSTAWCFGADEELLDELLASKSLHTKKWRERGMGR
ncbi:unnamed protein product [Vitrella brassicaformis CCMP3155]|uniref:Uncharacterized protein n=2 Tax=Vitrella brassicaformis TaxID=1169539 RepID=A0A0G4ET67_VITBC|nr:unnamed protein product [Vitrella brassicaformis CCMP3155]|eukprot:CEM01092.1 unnamed protein product [Vitrella brassicaformis CCMP3155]